MIHVHLNIGSNLGDREENLRQAVSLLRQLAVANSTVRVSSIIASPPWGYSSANEFLNAGISFDTCLTPQELLQAVQAIERSISTASHRASDGTYIDRLIDIDIIACATIADTDGGFTGCDDIKDCTTTPSQPFTLTEINTATLTLPHPRAHLRDFIMIPLREIDPTLYRLLAK